MPRRRFSAFSMGTQIYVESKIEPKCSEGFMGLLKQKATDSTAYKNLILSCPIQDLKVWKPRKM